MDDSNSQEIPMKITSLAFSPSGRTIGNLKPSKDSDWI